MFGNVRKMRLVGADVGHLMRDAQMAVRVSTPHCNIVADHPGAAPMVDPSSGNQIGEGDLLIGRGQAFTFSIA